MIKRILNSKNLVAYLLAAATGMTLYFRAAFPEGDLFLRIMATRSASAFAVLKYSYTFSLFSTGIVTSIQNTGSIIRIQEVLMAGPAHPQVQQLENLTVTFEPLLDSAEAAALLKIHPKTLQKMARNRDIDGIQIGRLWRFRASVLNSWLLRKSRA
jgi:excisionase family DNA binding protein